MLSNNVLPAFLALAGAVAAQAPAWGQCGGQGWVGPTVCVDGWTCVKLNQWFSTCQQVTTTQGPPPASTIISTVPPPSSTAVTCDAPWDKLEGYGAKTTGGGNGSVTNVTTCAELKTAAKKGGVIQVSGTLDKCGIIDLTDDTTLIGEKYYSGFQNGGIRIKDANNVIVRNLKFVHPPKGKDSIALDGATNVWIDHNEFQNDGLRGEKDYYDGLIDITHGSDFVTVSWNSFQDHWKGSLVGHSASNKKEDEGHLHVTYHHNWWFNVNSRTPSLRFGTGHIYSSCYEHIPTSGLNIREGAKALVENNNFILVNQSIVTNVDAKVQGFVTERNNIFYESPTIITQKGHVEPPYEYTLDPASCVCDRIYWYSGTGAVGL